MLTPEKLRGFSSGLRITPAGEGAHKFDSLQYEIRKVTEAERRSGQGLTTGIVGHLPQRQQTPPARRQARKWWFPGMLGKMAKKNT